MSDELVASCVIHLNIVRAKLLARVAHHQLGPIQKEWQQDDLDRFIRAVDHVKAALSFLDQSKHIDDEIQLELPW